LSVFTAIFITFKTIVQYLSTVNTDAFIHPFTASFNIVIRLPYNASTESISHGRRTNAVAKA